MPESRAKDTAPAAEAAIRLPSAKDGPAVWDLVAACSPLEGNSLYANVLQCTHFADTCRAAERDGRLVGWVSGYRVPGESSTVFIWQVAVSPEARGQGLGRRLLEALTGDLRRDEGVRRLQTTITEDNAPSWGLFEAFAAESGATLTRTPHLGRETHFGGRHDTEYLVTIGPLPSAD